MSTKAIAETDEFSQARPSRRPTLAGGRTVVKAALTLTPYVNWGARPTAVASDLAPGAQAVLEMTSRTISVVFALSLAVLPLISLAALGAHLLLTLLFERPVLFRLRQA